MKKSYLFILLMVIAFLCAGCAQPQTQPVQSAASGEQPKQTVQAPEQPAESNPSQTRELYVFAAASMTETLEEIAALYEDKAPEIELVFNFDSSGTLKTQIEEGAECDVFISAAQKQMNELNDLDLIDPDTRSDLLENKVALVVPDGNPAGIESFSDLAKKLESGADILLAVGNSDVPVGQYTVKIFDYFKLNEEELVNEGLLSYGTNVKEVTTQVSEASVDAGIIYQTDAYSAGLEIIDTATPEMCGQVIYPAAVLKASENKEAAREFLNYLKTKPCAKVFESVGFTPVG